MLRYHHRVLVSFGFALFFTLMPVAGAQDVAREDTVIFDLDRTIPDPTNFNWFLPDAVRQHGAHQAMWEPLFILNYETADIEPWLGLSLIANDALDSWTLTLREGVRWSDGEVFDADDVVFTIEMLLSLENATVNEVATLRQTVASVSWVDDYTVQFVLKSPNPRFLLDNFAVRNFGSVLIMPEHVWAGHDPITFRFYDEDAGWPIGTGPYTLASTSETRVEWDRHDTWWGVEVGFRDLPAPRRLVWLSSSTEDERARLMATNELDAANSMRLGTFENLQAQNDKVIAWRDELPFAWADPCPRQLDFNTTSGPWASASMRQALNLLIDRDEIIAHAYEGATVPSLTMFVQYEPMQPFINAVLAEGMGLVPSADIFAGLALIEAEGWVQNTEGLYEKDGETLRATILVNTASVEYTATVDVIVDQLRRVGIDAAARPVDNATYWGTAAPTGDYQIAYGWLSCGSVFEPWASMSRYTTDFVVPAGTLAPGINNTGRWNTPNAAAYTEVVDRIGELPIGDPAVPDLVAEAYVHLFQDMPFIPLVQASKIVPYNETYWRGWPTAENNYNHPAFWWNHTHQIIHNLEKSE